MKSSAVSSAMAGLIHPGIAHIALQQNTTASRIRLRGFVCSATKRKPARQSNMHNCYKSITYRAQIGFTRWRHVMARRPGCVSRMDCRRASGMKMASPLQENIVDSGKLPVAAPALSL
jgi:hypothetical protein